MQFLSTSILILSAAAGILAAPLDAVANNAAITRFTLNGSGCPPGTTLTTNDGTSLVTVYSQFTPSVSTQDFRQNCQATIEVSVPAGKKFTVDQVGYSGFAQLDSQAKVVHGTTVYFQAQLEQQSSSATLKGPVVQDVDLSDTVFDKNVWSQCGATSAIVNIDISIYLTASNADGFAAVDQAKFGPFKLVDC